jgi:hypothetical protein
MRTIAAAIITRHSVLLRFRSKPHVLGTATCNSGGECFRALCLLVQKSMHVAKLEKHQSAEIESTSNRTPAARGRCSLSFILLENLDLFTQWDLSPGSSVCQFSPYPLTPTRSCSFRPLFTGTLHGRPDRMCSSSSGGCYDNTCVRGSTINLPACGVPLRSRNQSERASEGKANPRCVCGEESSIPNPKPCGALDTPRWSQPVSGQSQAANMYRRDECLCTPDEPSLICNAPHVREEQFR